MAHREQRQGYRGRSRVAYTPSMHDMVLDNPSRRPENNVILPPVEAQKIRGQASSHIAKQNGDTSAIGSHVNFPGINKASKSNMAPESFSLGHIVFAPYCTPNLDPTATFDNPDVCASEKLGSILAKERPWIVLGILAPSGLIAVPLFSSDGKGPAALPRLKKDECIMVARRDTTLDWVKGIKNTQTLYVEPGFWWDPGRFSYVKMTEMQLLKFEWKMRIIGRLEHESTDICRKWFGRYLQASVMPLDEQKEYLDRFMLEEDWNEPRRTKRARTDSYRPDPTPIHRDDRADHRPTPVPSHKEEHTGQRLRQNDNTVWKKPVPYEGDANREPMGPPKRHLIPGDTNREPIGPYSSHGPLESNRKQRTDSLPEVQRPILKQQGPELGY